MLCEQATTTCQQVFELWNLGFLSGLFIKCFEVVRNWNIGRSRNTEKFRVDRQNFITIRGHVVHDPEFFTNNFRTEKFSTGRYPVLERIFLTQRLPQSVKLLARTHGLNVIDIYDDQSGTFAQ